MKQFLCLLALLVGIDYCAQAQYGDLLENGFDCYIPFDHTLVKQNHITAMQIDGGAFVFFDTTGFSTGELTKVEDTTFWETTHKPDTIFEINSPPGAKWTILDSTGRVIKTMGTFSGRDFAASFLELYFYDRNGRLDSIATFGASEIVANFNPENLIFSNSRKYLYRQRALQKIINYTAKGEIVSEFIFKSGRNGLPLQMLAFYPEEKVTRKFYRFKYFRRSR
jgi:hypothetical protein